MMKITGSNLRNRDPRYVYDKPVRIHSDDDNIDEIEGQKRPAKGIVHNVSMSGVAISTDLALVENGQFVNMHIEGLGEIAGNVARVYKGGVAIAFEEDEESKKRVATALRGLNQLA
ncbi:MAG: PilZ domain-containing protein [Rhodospirillales bacterium]|jgi:hypothetical protein|nr:PilZ domain-containing protein [Rhodospirillales bacterium]